MSAIYLVMGLIGVYLIRPPKPQDDEVSQKKSLLNNQDSITS